MLAALPRQNGSPCHYRRFREEKGFLPLPGNEPRFFGRFVCSLVTTLIELFTPVQFKAFTNA